MLKFHNLFFIAAISSLTVRVQTLEIPLVTDLQDVIGLAHDVGDIASGNVPFLSFFQKTVNPLTVIQQSINQISDQITDLQNILTSQLDNVLDTIMTRIPLLGNIDDATKELHEFISTIDTHYDDFILYTDDIDDYDKETLEEFITIMTSATRGHVPDLLNRMFFSIVPKPSAITRDGFFALLRQQQDISKTSELCNMDISFQNRLYKVYQVIIVNELKAFTMATFAYRLRNHYRNSTATGEVKRVQAKFIMRTQQYLLELKNVLRGETREIYRCDPPKHIHGETYEEFRRFIRLIILNEHQASWHCQNTCGEMWVTSYAHKCFRESFWGDDICLNQICETGLVSNCGWIGGEVRVCENPSDAEQRYQYIYSLSNGYYGRWSYCENGGRYSSFNDHIEDIYRCDNCLCSCIEYKPQSKATRTFSLRPQISNIGENKVVSDIRFQVKDRMIQIQIQEAPLLESGMLDKRHANWIELENFKYYENGTYGTFGIVNGDQELPLKADEDYSILFRNQRDLYLDEIIAGPGYVLTGVRLKHVDPDKLDGDGKNVSPIEMEIYVTPFDYHTGKLNPSDDNPSVWLRAETQPNPPADYLNERSDGMVGRKSYAHSENQVQMNPPILKTNLRVVFDRSDSTHDAGQYTVPFFDIRQVAEHNQLAFSGLGMIVRAEEHFSGFLAFKFLNLDLTQYINTAINQEQLNFYKRKYREPLAHSPTIVN